MKQPFLPSQLSVSNFTLAAGVFGLNRPALLVLVISVAIGLLMVIVFRYTSDQKAIHVAKEQLKAHLLAVRLFQDQLSAVLREYGRILRGTARYIRLAFGPLLIVSIPMIFFMVQVDRYLGWTPMLHAQPFLVTVRTTTAEGVNNISLQLPPELLTTAPAVHVPADREVVWRVVPEKDGKYDIQVVASGQTLSKSVVVSGDVGRVSPIRIRGHFWERLFNSGEQELPERSPVESIAVNYPSRDINFFGYEANWILAFFVLSLVAGFIFKEVLGIEI
jgi:uncharacterized membrane protein (DUF106 family)